MQMKHFYHQKHIYTMVMHVGSCVSSGLSLVFFLREVHNRRSCWMNQNMKLKYLDGCNKVWPVFALADAIVTRGVYLFFINDKNCHSLCTGVHSDCFFSVCT